MVFTSPFLAVLVQVYRLRAVLKSHRQGWFGGGTVSSGVGLRYFASGTAWSKLEGKGGVGSCCCWQGIDFFERCICKHSDDFVEFCEFQSSIKQPTISVLCLIFKQRAISVQCLILDRRQATSSLAGCLATYCSLIGQIGSASQRVTSLWNEGLNARHHVWASYFQSGPTFQIVYILFSRESRRNI